ncbi:MAG: hypothetical protein MI861_00335, partial [Pirellulales bacterium]|nr:hypothetical protein [Pirellulales bacterium]
LARWLANGPWDVDNDGDGIPDSIWLDLALPTFTAPDGTLLRPLVAPLIEDLDGKINLNTAGNYGQMPTNFFGLDFTSGASPTPNTYRLTARGFGVGPAEVYPGFILGRTLTSVPVPVVNTAPLPNVLSTTMGNLLRMRYGGQFSHLGAPGNEELMSGTATIFSNDPVSRMIHPTRRNVHADNAPMGLPMDMYGRGAIDFDEQGNVVVQNLSAAFGTAQIPFNEQFNEPYEWATNGPPLGNDQPYSAEEFLAVIQRGVASRTAFRSRLLELLDVSLRNNPQLERLITTESRSQRVPEMSGYGGSSSMLGSAVDLYVSRLEQFMGPSNNPTNIANIENTLTKMLAVELRKGTKLNLNRPIGNGLDDNTNGLVDEAAETNGFPAV